MANIYYIIPDAKKPTGGILINYLHCYYLRKNGYNAYPLHMGDFELDWFSHDLEYKTYRDIGYELTESDIVVGAEVFPYEPFLFKKCKRVIFVQNWIYIYGMKHLTLKQKINYRIKGYIPVGLHRRDSKKSYYDIGYDGVITPSKYIEDYLKDNMGINSNTITNGIDLEKFIANPAQRIPNTILCLTRKNKDDIYRIKDLVEKVSSSKAQWVICDNMPQDELIKKYQESDIFLSTGYPEGFGLPHLEAMACGCTVVGFTGGAASMFMKDNVTALVSKDGDCEDAAKKISLVLHNKEIKERLRSEGIKKAQQYSLERMENELIDFYKKFNN